MAVMFVGRRVIREMESGPESRAETTIIQYIVKNTTLINKKCNRGLIVVV